MRHTIEANDYRWFTDDSDIAEWLEDQLLSKGQTSIRTFDRGVTVISSSKTETLWSDGVRTGPLLVRK